MATEHRKICIVGMGYVGLTLAAIMSDRGFDVWGVEKNPDILKMLMQGKPHFLEKGFEPRIKGSMNAGRLHFLSELSELNNAQQEPLVYIITVGTPLNDQGRPRMDMIESVAREIANHMNDDALVILRSTVQLGTTRKIVEKTLEQSGKQFGLAYCPERTIEGNAMAELAVLPQIIGGLTEAAALQAEAVFRKITPTVIMVSSLESAEIIKLLDNSYRDLNFAIGNEVALLCEAAGLDSREIIEAANTGYARTQISDPGFVGGPCLYKDPHILQASLEAYGYVPQLIKQGRALNESLPNYVCDRLDDTGIIPNKGKDTKISILGMAFKGRPETDDTRASSSLDIVACLRQRYPEAMICGHDFAVGSRTISNLGVTPVDLEQAFDCASVMIVANNNKKYEWIDLDALTMSMATPAAIYDIWSVLPAYRGLYSENKLRFMHLGNGSGSNPS